MQVVKAHYILSTATYDSTLSYSHRIQKSRISTTTTRNTTATTTATTAATTTAATSAATTATATAITTDAAAAVSTASDTAEPTANTSVVHHEDISNLVTPVAALDDPMLGVSRENSLEKAGNNFSDVTMYSSASTSILITPAASENSDTATTTVTCNGATSSCVAGSAIAFVPAYMININQDGDMNNSNSVADDMKVSEIVVKLFTCKDDAISQFNMFLPVLVQQ